LLNLFLTCGSYSPEKKMPSMVMELSGRQAALLIDSMLSGDGHRHAKGHGVYYTSSKRLADDLYALMVKNGIMGQIYGPYDVPGYSPMYQVFISRARSGKWTSSINKQQHRPKSGWKKYTAKGDTIVCFTVSNSTLITRNNGKVAIQGNCKNIMHCIRLLISGINILRNGEPIVRFAGTEQEFLMDIRRGKFAYEYLMKVADDKMAELDALYKTSLLPHEVDMQAIDNLYLELVENYR